jgi:hypothetical protein
MALDLKVWALASTRKGMALDLKVWALASTRKGMALDLKIGDLVRLKKAHPCGSRMWEVKRLGADIGIACQRCGRYILVPRSYLERRVREVVPRARPGDAASGGS